jgi:hypothetical protein
MDRQLPGSKTESAIWVETDPDAPASGDTGIQAQGAEETVNLAVCSRVISTPDGPASDLETISGRFCEMGRQVIGDNSCVVVDELMASIASLAELAVHPGFVCSRSDHQDGNPLEVAVSLCESLYYQKNADIKESSTRRSTVLPAALGLVGLISWKWGLPQQKLQRLLSMLAPPASGQQAPLEPDLWFATLSMLQKSAGLDKEQPGSNSFSPLPPYVTLRGKGGLCGACVCGEISNPRSPKRNLHANAGNLMDTSEVVRNKIFAKHGVTFGAWVFLHPNAVCSTCEVEMPTLWRYWEPECGGWTLTTRKSSGNSEDSFDIIFTRLAFHSPTPAADSKSIIVGQVPAGRWFPLTVELKHQPGGHDRLCVGGTRRWSQVDLGSPGSKSQFPPPGSTFGSDRSMAAVTIDRDENSASDFAGSVVFFENMCADRGRRDGHGRRKEGEIQH